MTDEPQFSSNEFPVFTKSWSFNHVTTSPRYPQSNGKAENAVWTVKSLFKLLLVLLKRAYFPCIAISHKWTTKACYVRKQGLRFCD